MSKKRIKTLVIWGIVIAIVVTAIVLLVTVVNKVEEVPDYQIEGTTLVQYNGKDENVVIPKNVKTIGKAAFKNNTSMRTLSFEKGTEIQKIANGAFEGCAALDEVTLPSGLIEISDYAFKDCVSLKYFELSPTVEIVGKFAFKGCSNITAFDLNEGLISLGDNAFEDCAALEFIVLPASLTTFGEDVFLNASTLRTIQLNSGSTSFVVEKNILYTYDKKEIIVAGKTDGDELTIPNSVEKIHSNAFFNAASIKTLVVGNNVKYIGENAFVGCTKLQSATLPFIGQTLDGNTKFISVFGSVPETLTTIKITQGTKVIADAFANLSKVTSIELPSSVKYIGESAFEGCSSLGVILNLPNNLEIIYENTFKGCTALKNNVIKNLINSNLEVILGGAFAGCEQISSLNLENVKHIGAGAFEGCVGLKSISLPFIGMGYEYTEINGGTYQLSSNLNTDKLFGYIFSSDDITDNSKVVPQALIEVTILGTFDVPSKSFINSKYIQTINLANGVKNIGDQAFKGCSSLQSFVVPEELETLGASAFEGCSALATLTNFPAKLTVINDNLFYDCSSLQSLEIGKDIVSIGKYAFYNCNADVTVHAENAKFETHESSLYTTGLETLIRYRANSADQKEFTFNPATVVIDEGAFLNANNLETIIVPNTIKEIKQFAFVSCSNLKSIQLPFIGNVGEEYAEQNNISRNPSFDCIFAGAKPSSLSLTISDGETIGNGAFSNNSYITEITLSDTFKEIEASAFEKCTALKVVNFGTPQNPAQITYIGNRAFSNCVNLENIVLADTITEIGDFAFAECAKIREITLPKDLEVIGEGVFMNCSSLFKLNLTDDNQHYKVVDGSQLVSKDGSKLVVYAAGPETIGQINILEGTIIQMYLNGAYSYAYGEKVYSDYSFTNVIGTYDGKTNVVINDVKYTITGKGLQDANGDLVEGSKIDTRIGIAEINGIIYFISSNKLFSDENKENQVGQINENNKTFNLNNVNYCYDNFNWYFEDQYHDFELDTNITEIYSYAFSSANRITSVVLHNNVTKLGDGVFFNCSSLTEVTLPTTIERITSKMFENCSALAVVNNVENVTIIDAFAFRNCSAYDGSIITTKLTEIGQYSFEGCESITTVELSDSMTEVANGAFKGCTSLSTVIYSDNITTIGDFAFMGCSKLATFDLPANLETIGISAFENAAYDTSLSDKNIMVMLPDKLTTISQNAFRSARYIRTIYIPESVEVIGLDGVNSSAATSIFTDKITITETTDEEGNVEKYYNYPEQWDAIRNIQPKIYAKGEYEMVNGIPTPIVTEEESESSGE